MDYKVPGRILQKNSVNFAYFAPSIPPVARDAILKAVIDLEYEFQLYLLAALRLINPKISDSELDHGGIFSEPNMLSSLSKCLRLAKTLELINDIEFHDIKKLINLRNMYAHGRHRKELSEDADAVAVLRSMKIYENSKEELSVLNHGKAFFCCVDYFVEIIGVKRSALSKDSIENQ